MAWQAGEAIRILLRIRKKLRDIVNPLILIALSSPALTSVSMALAERMDRPTPDLMPSLTAVDEPNRAETSRVPVPSLPDSSK